MWRRAKIDTQVEAPSQCELRLPVLSILTDDTILHLSEIISEASTLVKLSLSCKRLSDICSTDFLWRQRIINEYGNSWKNVLPWTEQRQITRLDNSIDFKSAYVLLSHPRVDFECLDAAPDAIQMSKAVARVAISVHGSPRSGKSAFITSCKQVRGSNLTSSAPQRREVDFSTEGFLIDTRTQQLIQYEVNESVNSQMIPFVHAFVMMVDITNRDSFCEVSSTWSNIKAASSDDSQFLLVGTFSDPRASRKVSKAELTDLASSMSCRYVEIANLNDRKAVIDTLRLLISAVSKSYDVLFPRKTNAIETNKSSSKASKLNASNVKRKNVLSSLLRRSIKGL